MTKEQFHGAPWQKNSAQTGHDVLMPSCFHLLALCYYLNIYDPNPVLANPCQQKGLWETYKIMLRTLSNDMPSNDKGIQSGVFHFI